MIFVLVLDIHHAHHIVQLRETIYIGLFQIEAILSKNSNLAASQIPSQWLTEAAVVPQKKILKKRLDLPAGATFNVFYQIQQIKDTNLYPQLIFYNGDVMFFS